MKPEPVNTTLLNSRNGSMAPVDKVDYVSYTSSREEFLHLQLVANIDFAKTSPSHSIAQDHYTKDFANAAILFPFAFGLRSHRNFKFDL